MADFEEALNSLLADPDAMGQIMALAGKLGGEASPAPPSEVLEEAEAAGDPPPLMNMELLGQLGKLLELFQSSGQSKQEAVTLLTALRPFLRSAQQRKLDRAIRLAGMSGAARQAYLLWKEGELHV